jgi:hypothetical protein
VVLAALMMVAVVGLLWMVELKVLYTCGRLMILRVLRLDC